MNNHKIAGLLLPMATSEKVLREFAQYVKESHPSNVEHLTSMLRYVLNKRKRLKDADLDKKKVFKQLFPEENYMPSRMTRLYAMIIRLAEKFLVDRELKKRPDLLNFLLAKSLNDLQLESHAKKKLENNLENLPDEEQERYAISEKTHRKLFFRVERNLKEKKRNRRHLEQGFIDLDIFSTIGKLKYSCQHISRQRILGEPIKPNIQQLIDRTLAFVPYRDEIPLIDIQADSIMFLQAPDRVKFQALKQKFLLYLDKLHSEKKEILLYLINGLAFIEHENRLTEYFELNKIGVENGLFIENKEIAPNNFNNIVYGGCERGEIEWTEKFIKSHFQYLKRPEESLENIKTLYGCFLNYAKQDYQQVLVDLKNINFEDYSYSLHKYSLLLKCTYELEGHEACIQISELVNAFKSFLNRCVDQNYMSKERRQKYLNSLNTLNRIAKSPFDKKLGKENLIKYYEAFHTNIVYAKWLWEKIQALKG